MASRDASTERGEARMVKHQHSFSENGRLSAAIPMWDSSDPDRAPPPLPLNPVTNSPITKPHVSTNIEKAAALIASRALENTPSAYTSNPPPSASPERNMGKPQHKRMQSIQAGNVGRLSDSLERRSPDKGLNRAKAPNLDDLRTSRSPERAYMREPSISPTPIERTSTVSDNKLFTDENKSPADGVLSLQTFRRRADTESPLRDITNGAASLKSNMSLESLSTQILNITTIATNLQKEMTNLSRRSKDNATDLMGLKEATNTRDEDIRRSLRDLATKLERQIPTIDTRVLGASEASRSTPNLGVFLEDDVQTTPTRKSFHLNRVTSPTLFDRQITASPSVVSVDGAASIALLEKVLREMATKDGQDRIMSTLENVKVSADSRKSHTVKPNDRPAIDPEMMRKLEEILVFMKDMKADSGSRALVKATTVGIDRSPSQMDMFLERDSRNAQVAKVRYDEPRSSTEMNVLDINAGNEDMVKTLKGVKQSLSQNGGLTNEVKALVRELRGEVMGMGREISRKLEASGAQNDSKAKALHNLSAEDIHLIVDQGVAEMKEHMHHIVQESQKRLESMSSSIDTSEVVRAVCNAVAESSPRQDNKRDFAAEKEEMLHAIREAWEECKPDIALEHFGLERDEILETLKEGLQSYEKRDMVDPAVHLSQGATYDQVLEAVQRGLEDFRLPELSFQSDAMKEEIVGAIKESLEHIELPSSSVPSQLSTSSSDLSRDEIVDAVREVLLMQAPSSRGPDFTRDEMLEAIKEGVSAQSHVTKEIEFNREDLFDAIKACLEGDHNPMGLTGERIVDAMHEFLGSMKTEFQQYSAANGRDTEQVLDALKDGLEELRGDIETYVDRAQDVTGKDEIVDTVKAGFAAMQADMDKGFATRSSSAVNTPELLDAMEKEFEHLRDTIGKSLSRGNEFSEKTEILDAIRDLSDDRASTVSGNSEDIVRLVKDELAHLRTTLASTLIKNGGSFARDEVLDAIREGLEGSRNAPRGDGNESILSNTSELLDAFQDGVDAIRADMQKLVDKPTDMGAVFDVLDDLKTGIDGVRTDIERLGIQHADSDVSGERGREVTLHEGNNITTEIEGLKVMITQLRIKVEALDQMPFPEPVLPSQMHLHKDDLNELHAAIQEVHESLNSVPRTAPEVVMPSNAASKEDTEAIETILRNVRAKLDDLVMPGGSQLETIEHALSEIKAAVFDSSGSSADLKNKEDFALIELMLKEVQSSVDTLTARSPSSEDGESHLTKTDLQVLESICLETREKLEALSAGHVSDTASKDDIVEVMEVVKSFKEQFEADNDLTAQAFEARKIEHGGLATKMDDVKVLIAEARDEVMSKLSGNEEGLVELAKVLGMHHDSMSTYATEATISELRELVEKGFDSYAQHQSASKTDMEERDATLFGKHEEATSDLKAQIEERFNELMTKYDDAQTLSEAKLSAMDDRDKAHMEAATAIKTSSTELRSLMETLGTTVSETCDKVSTDSRTTYEKIDDVATKVTELHLTVGTEHRLTRDEIVRAYDATARIEGALSEHQPTMLATIQEILGIVGEHYQHSQQHSENWKTSTEEIKSSVNAIPSAIPPLLPPPEMSRQVSDPVEQPLPNAYDDRVIRSKLDELLSHTAAAKLASDLMEAHHKTTHQSLSSLQKLDGLDRLDAIDEHIRATADAVAQIVSTQTERTTAQNESKAAEAAAASLALEKRLAHKERIEAEIASLTQEKNGLADSMRALRQEHEVLFGQTKKLSREVGKLEMALQLRQEEMRDMNARAEALERRVLEGVMNHARSAKLAKPPPKRKTTSAERDASMSLKRVPSTASNATAKASSVSKGVPALSNAVGMALKKRSPLGHAKNTVTSRPSGVDRRILSLSSVTGPKSAEPQRALVLAPNLTTGLVSLKRSHSVKSNPSSYLGGRKPSWNGTDSLLDKENKHVEEAAAAEIDRSPDSDDGLSESGTERRTSYTGTYTDSMVYGTGSSVSRNSMRSVSYASSVGGTLNGHAESIMEEDEESEDEASNLVPTPEEVEGAEDADDADGDQEDQFEDSHETNGDSRALSLAVPQRGHSPGAETQLAMIEAMDEVGDLPHIDAVHHHDMKYAVPSDSGIGSELPTPDSSNHGSQAWQSSISS